MILTTDEIDRLEKIIPLGWSIFSYINKWMIIPLFSLLSGLNSGIIILILTLILKTLNPLDAFELDVAIEIK